MSFFQWVKYSLLVVFLPGSRLRKEWQMLRFLNRDRKDFGLLPLKMQFDLRDVAREHSKDMARKDYFDHVNFKGDTPADRLAIARVTDSTTGENLAKIGGYPEPVKEAEEGLMKSPGHRANILNKEFNCVGIGVVKSKDGVFYFTQNFAKRLLVFTKKVRKTISIKKGLRLEGTTIEPVSEVYFYVKALGQIVEKGFHEVIDSKFSFTIKFEETGKYEVSLFVPESKGKMRLSNAFEVSVRSWWFWF
jgi:hypothetical protein